MQVVAEDEAEDITTKEEVEKRTRKNIVGKFHHPRVTATFARHKSQR